MNRYLQPSIVYCCDCNMNRGRIFLITNCVFSTSTFSNGTAGSINRGMALTNEQVLTRGDKKYAAKKRAKQAEEVKFDSGSREEFLTGFHKRKLARKENAKKKAAEMNRQQRLAERRKLREERKQKLGDLPVLAKEVAQVEELKKIGTSTLDSDTDDASSMHSSSANASIPNSPSESEDEAEFSGFSESSGILKRRSKYGNTDVLIEEINLDPFVDVSRSEQVLEEATKKAHDYAKYVEALEAEQKKAAQKKRKRKFKYIVPKRRASR